jgi:hypothetical protein
MWFRIIVYSYSCKDSLNHCFIVWNIKGNVRCHIHCINVIEAYCTAFNAHYASGLHIFMTNSYEMSNMFLMILLYGFWAC